MIGVGALDSEGVPASGVGACGSTRAFGAGFGSGTGCAIAAGIDNAAVSVAATSQRRVMRALHSPLANRVCC
jgi:hypothetical protein